MRPPQERPTRQAVSSATPNSSILGAPTAMTSSASVTTAPSTQPPETEPRKLPSPSITRCEPTGRGAEPQVSTTVATATSRPASRQSCAATRMSSSVLSIFSLCPLDRPRLRRRRRRNEADRLMRAVAIRLVLGCAATAKRGRLRPVDRTAGAGQDFDAAADPQRAIGVGRDFQDAAALGEHFARLGRRLAGRDKAGAGMRAVAIRFVGGGAAAAERGARADRLAGYFDLRADRQRAVLTNGDGIDGGNRLRRAAVMARHLDGPRGTVQRDENQLLRRGGVRVDPRPLDIRFENLGLGNHTAPRVDAPLPIETDRRPFAGDLLDRMFAHGPSSDNSS